MAHLQIQVPSRSAPAVTRQIAAEGLLHLIDIAHGRVSADDASPAGTRESLAAFRELVRRVRQAAARLAIALPDVAGSICRIDVSDFGDELRAIDARFRPIESAVDALWRRRAEADEHTARARQTARAAASLARAGVDLARLGSLRFTSATLGFMPAGEIGTLAAGLSPTPFAIVPLDESDPARVLAAVAVPATFAARVPSALRVVAFEPVPDLAAARGTPPERALEDAQAAERGVAADLAALKARAHDVVAECAQRAECAALLLQAQTHFAASGRYVVISGWIPADKAARMSQAIVAATGGRAIVDVARPEDLPEAVVQPERIPILYRNPILLRPFQTLVEIYGVPSYGEVPPTAFFAVSFLVMFGMMFGDIGHGVVLASAGYCLFRYLPQYLDYGLLLMECGAVSAIFGALYGSLFGIEGLLPVLWMEPVHDLRRFMAVAIGLGVVLVSAGLVINVVNAWRAGDRASALTGPRGVFGACLYWITIALVTRAFMPATFVLPLPALAALFAVPVLLIVFRRPILARVNHRGTQRPADRHAPRGLALLEGSVELVDAVFSYFANTISFVRVAAFAAVHAGVFIAMYALVDTLAQFRHGHSLGIATLVIGNVVMILLEGLTVSVQVLRLEYYEFFGKFFRGGGELYRPLMFGRRNGDTGA